MFLICFLFILRKKNFLFHTDGPDCSGLVDVLMDITFKQAELAKCKSKLSWEACMDVNGVTRRSKALSERIKYIQRIIDRDLRSLEHICLDDWLADFRRHLSEILMQSIDCYERYIEKLHRPHGLQFDTKAIFNLTDCDVPYDILVGLSFGHKFMFPFNLSVKNTDRVLALLECTINNAISPILQDAAAKEVSLALIHHENKIQDPIKRWLSFVKKRTDRFFSVNRDIAAIKSDKGNHTVLIRMDDYKERVLEHLQDPAYKLLYVDPLDKLIKMETHLVAILKDRPHTMGLVRSFQPNCLFLPLFYGVIKVHKNNAIRPITAATGAVGSTINAALHSMVSEIFPIKPHHIRDSFDFKNKIDKVRLRDDDVMVSMDIISMYTSIPTGLVIEIVMNESSRFRDRFGVTPDELRRMLCFVLTDCAVFVFDGRIYQQVSGLPMGGSMSPIAARLVMDKIIDSFNALFPEPPSFMGIFVDDSIFVLPNDLADIALDILNNCFPGVIKFTMETELKKKINFLNLTLIRTDNAILTNWFKKPFASDRLLNYHSCHKKSIILGTAEHFIKTVLILSDGIFFLANKPIVENRLRINNFPEEVISSLMNNTYTLMRPVGNVAVRPFRFYQTQCSVIDVTSSQESHKSMGMTTERNVYVSFPHAISNAKRIKEIIDQYKHSHVTLADSIRNTKNNSIRNLKDPMALHRRADVIVVVQCKCRKFYKIDKTSFNETGSMTARRLCNHIKACHRLVHAFNEVTYIRGMAFSGQNEFLLKYIRWRHRDMIRDGRLNLPNVHLCRLLK